MWSKRRRTRPIPKSRGFKDYFDENGEGDWDAYDRHTPSTEALQKLGKLDVELDGGAVLAFANRTLGKIFADREPGVFAHQSVCGAQHADGDDRRRDEAAGDGIAGARPTARRCGRRCARSVDERVSGRRAVGAAPANGAFLRENADVKQEAGRAGGLVPCVHLPRPWARRGGRGHRQLLNQNTGGLLSQETREILTEVTICCGCTTLIYYKSSYVTPSRAAGRGRTCVHCRRWRGAENGVHAPDGERQLSVWRGLHRRAPVSLNYGRMVFALVFDRA